VQGANERSDALIEARTLGDCAGVVPVRFGFRLTAPYGMDFHANHLKRTGRAVRTSRGPFPGEAQAIGGHFRPKKVPHWAGLSRQATGA
jgi:hypothetical protein